MSGSRPVSRGNSRMRLDNIEWLRYSSDLVIDGVPIADDNPC